MIQFANAQPANDMRICTSRCCVGCLCFCLSVHYSAAYSTIFAGVIRTYTTIIYTAKKNKFNDVFPTYETVVGTGTARKAVLLQAQDGPEGSRKLRFPDFVTAAQDGGKVVSLTHRPPLPLGNTPGTHFC